MLRLEDIKKAVSSLSATDVLDISAFVERHIQNQALQVTFAKRDQAVLNSACPHCGFVCLIRWGRSDSDTQRFRCRNCKATVNSTVQTPFYRLRNRHLWARYLGLMGQHIALRRLRDDHGMPLSIPTLHRWRHRFLSALVANPAHQLAGLIEADEKFFRTAYKGTRAWKRGDPPQLRRARRRGDAQRQGLGMEQVPILTAMDRSGAIYQERIPDLKWKTISGKIAAWVEAGSVLCSDGNFAYRDAAAAAQCDHIVAKTKNRATTLSIGRIDAYHRDVENLVNRRCMGVSTRYLMNYFGWARRITQHKPFGNDWMGEMMGN